MTDWGRKSSAHLFVTIAILNSCVEIGHHRWANHVRHLINVYSVLEIFSGLALNYFVNSDFGLCELQCFHLMKKKKSILVK